VADFAEAVSLYNQLKFRKLVSIFGSVDELRDINFAKLACGGLFINRSPEDSSLPSAGMGFNSNITNGGSDILTHLVRKKFIFGMDQLKEAVETEEEAVQPDPAQVVTLIEEDSSDEDYADW
jgi:acyl-CoA reductase-like NAD-dependent aldehyde dehydrogenase